MSAIPVSAITPPLDAGPVLAGAQFGDAYAILVDGKDLDARLAAERLFERLPWWAAALMAVRDRIVGPLGLKTARDVAAAPRSIGFFPVVAESADRVIVGLDDRHLDFRIVVDLAPAGPATRVTVTTFVRTHGRPGRAYLAAVLPFHRRIVPAMLAGLAG